MTQQIVLHIGANKTGSSAIQKALQLNWRQLRDIGFLVPDRELGMTDRVTGEHVFSFQDMFARSDRITLEQKITALRKSDAKVILISAENLSNAANFQFFKRDLLGTDCKVVFYIRRQDELLTSSWQQWYSKSGPEFEAWLILALQKYGHWQRCIEGWESAAGSGNVVVRIFQKSDLTKGDVVEDFFSILELEKHSITLTKPSSLINPSYSDIITHLASGSELLFSNAHDNKFYEMVKDLTGDFYVKQKKVSLLSRQQRDSIIEYYRPQNELVCRRYFPGRPRLFEMVDHSRYEYLATEELTRRQIQFLASLVFSMYKLDRARREGKNDGKH